MSAHFLDVSVEWLGETSAHVEDSPKVIVTTKKRNVPFSKTDLVLIILASVLIRWQNQYNWIHPTVPESPCMLIPDLENIEHVMIEKYNKKLKVNGKASTACPNAKGKLKRGTSGGSSE
jgi:hypothetical protein